MNSGEQEAGARTILPRELSIATVDDVRIRLPTNAWDGEPAIDASKVEIVDLAGLQLLVALLKAQPNDRSAASLAANPHVHAAMRRAGFDLAAMN